MVLSKTAELLYKCDNYYAPKAEAGVIYNDDTAQIDWRVPTEDLIISPKDLILKTLAETKLSF